MATPLTALQTLSKEERVDSWKVGDVAGNEPAYQVGEANNGNDERSQFHVNWNSILEKLLTLSSW